MIARAVLDALTDSGAIRDDSQVAFLTAGKVWDAQPGVAIALRALDDPHDMARQWVAR